MVTVCVGGTDCGGRSVSVASATRVATLSSEVVSNSNSSSSGALGIVALEDVTAAKAAGAEWASVRSIASV